MKRGRDKPAQLLFVGNDGRRVAPVRKSYALRQLRA
jgi:hypothetical protein